MNQRKWLLPCAATLLLLNACGGSSDEVAATWKSEREQRGDTLIVRTLSGSVWGDTMRLVPDVAIGELDRPPELVFGEIRGLDLDADGRLLVVDRQARNVRIFSQTGEHLLSFGQSGDGPGEFRAPDYIRALSDGRIVVRDHGAGRFSIFSNDGKYLGSWSHARGFSTTEPFYLDASERVVSPASFDSLVVYQLDGTPLDGTPFDTIAFPTLGDSAPQLTVNMTAGSATYDIPFMPDEAWTMARDGSVIIGFAAEYAFDRRGNDGRVLRIERVTDMIPVQDAEAAWHRDWLTRNILSSAPDWQWQGPDIPSVKPAFFLICSGIDGTIWVFRETRSVEEPNPNWKASDPNAGSPTLWRPAFVADVFDEDGRYLGPVKIPESLHFYSPQPIFSREWVWAAATSDAGFPQVVRFRIEPLNEP